MEKEIIDVITSEISNVDIRDALFSALHFADYPEDLAEVIANHAALYLHDEIVELISDTEQYVKDCIESCLAE